jgi:hypothetical protein
MIIGVINKIINRQIKKLLAYSYRETIEMEENWDNGLYPVITTEVSPLQ